MEEEKNGQKPNDEPRPATPEIIEKGADTEKEPPPATQDILEEAEEPPKAKEDVMIKMLKQEDLEKFSVEQEKEEEKK